MLKEAEKTITYQTIKTMAKIQIDFEQLVAAYPEAAVLPNLPRKKKKALKKKIAKMLIALLEYESQRIFQEYSLENLITEMTDAAIKVSQLEEKIKEDGIQE